MYSNDANIHFKYAPLLQIRLKEYEETKFHYLETLRIDPNHVNAHCYHANLLVSHFNEFKEQKNIILNH